MTVIVTSDIHLTDSPRDAHRFELLPWLAAQVNHYIAESVFILGDLTESKDRHSARLVNMFVEGLTFPTEILLANHDAIDPAWPFFAFTNRLANVRFIREPALSVFGIGTCGFIPFCKNFPEVLAGITNLNDARYIFCHQTFDGAKADNGTVLTGVPPAVFKGYKGKVFSGDIHSPQVVNKNPLVEYVGAPYRTDFGDTFTPRVLVIHDDGKIESIHFPCKNKHLITVRTTQSIIEFAKRQKVKPGDQVKIRAQLTRAEYVGWSTMRGQIRTIAEESGWELYGIEPELIDAATPSLLPDPLKQKVSAVDLVAAKAVRDKLDSETTKLGFELVQT